VHPKWHPQRRWLNFESAAAAARSQGQEPGARSQEEEEEPARARGGLAHHAITAITAEPSGPQVGPAWTKPTTQPPAGPSSAPPQASGLWGSMMGDEISASARLDRLAAHGIDSLLAVGG
jgi:hypothetical protein